MEKTNTMLVKSHVLHIQGDVNKKWHDLNAKRRKKNEKEKKTLYI